MIEKLKQLKINFALIAFLCFTVKMLVISASFADSIILLGLGSLYGYTQYLTRFQPYRLEDAVMRDLTEVKSALSKLNMSRVAEKSADRRYF